MYSKIKTVELSIKDIFNIAFTLFTENFKFLLIFGLIIYVPFGILFMIMFQSLDAVLNAIIYNTDLTLLMNHGMETLIVSSLIILIASFFSTPLIYAGVAGLANHIVDGNEASFKPIIDATFKKIGRHILAIFLFSLVVIPMMVLILPGIYFGVLFIFHPFVIAITDKKGFRAFAESRRVVQGNWFKTIGFLILTFMFSTMISNLLWRTQSFFNMFLINDQISFLVYFIFGEIITIYFRLVVALWFLNKFYLLRKED